MSAHGPQDSLTGAIVSGEIAHMFQDEPQQTREEQQEKHRSRHHSKAISTIQVREGSFFPVCFIVFSRVLSRCRVVSVGHALVPVVSTSHGREFPIKNGISESML